jgi:hypothetical protein
VEWRTIHHPSSAAKSLVAAGVAVVGPAAACYANGRLREERCSFLKKRTKKLLQLGLAHPAAYVRGKKFFDSFFQKRTADFA